MESDRQFSLWVSRALDCLGKSQNTVKFRIEHCKDQERFMHNNFYENVYEYIIAGSKGEGLTTEFENDFDIMQVANDVICADNIGPFRKINGITLFEADRRNTAPGYTILRLDNVGRWFPGQLIQQSLFKYNNEQLYFSSDFYLEYLIQCLISRDKFNWYRSGPSFSFSLNGIVSLSQDYVKAFLCSCPEIIESFITRPRNHDWPTNDQLIEILNMEGHVVPVGNKGSPTAFLEWRLCYTKAERYLMRSLNDTQTKTYILLKMVSKTYISLVCGDITSYVLKNIVLWLTEGCNIDTFKEELLVERLIQSLKFLRQCVINNNFPSYMIPERNIFSGKLDLAQRQNLIFLLTELIDKGGGLLFGCERLRCTMIVLYKEPALADQYRCKSDMIEKLFLWRMKQLSEDSLASKLTDKAFWNLHKIIWDILLPDRRSLERQGHDKSSLCRILMTRLLQWFS